MGGKGDGGGGWWCAGGVLVVCWWCAGVKEFGFDYISLIFLSGDCMALQGVWRWQFIS